MLLVISLFVFNAFAQSKFKYLVIEETALRTTHGLPTKISMDGKHTISPPIHRTDTFNDNPYEISLSAFLDDKVAIMIHSERVASGNGASNYSNLPLANWPLEGFRSTGAECMILAHKDADGEHDLEWLRSNGFEPTGTIIFSQYFKSTLDFNDEIVVSIILHVKNCENEAGNLKSLEKIKSRLHMETIK